VEVCDWTFLAVTPSVLASACTPCSDSWLNEWSLKPPTSPTTQGRNVDLEAVVAGVGAVPQAVSTATVPSAAMAPSPIRLVSDVKGGPFLGCCEVPERVGRRGPSVNVMTPCYE
jgi:hypothetical protein